MAPPAFRVLHTEARSILSPTTGFIAEAGFTHSLTPARNCTFGCTYCYVPTMRIFGGLKPEDWRAWGQFTTIKDNAPALLRREVRGDEAIYCSPVVDPYQPAEQNEAAMERILDALIERPPRVFTIQTRGPLILRDVERLRRLAERTTLRVSFSLTTNREQVRKWFEPHCAPFEERLAVISELRRQGIAVFATLAPLLPSDVEELAESAIEATRRDLIGDPLHVRSVKKSGATTREEAWRIAEKRGFEQWFEPAFQAEVTARIRAVASRAGLRFAVGPEGFSWLAQN